MAWLGKALELLIPYAWRPVDDGGLGLYQLTAGCAAGNRASARALRRAGFALVGTERQAIRVDESADDALVFDLLATDDRDARRVQPGRLPVIETERFRLRPWTSRDVPDPDEGPDPGEPAVHAARRPPRRVDVPGVVAPPRAGAGQPTSTSTGPSPTARPTTRSAT